MPDNKPEKPEKVWNWPRAFAKSVEALVFLGVIMSMAWCCVHRG